MIIVNFFQRDRWVFQYGFPRLETRCRIFEICEIPKMGQSVEMCAIYKYGNDDVLRVNAFFSLFVQFDAFCFHLI